ncbi:MAG: D-aminoacyl-tRNA deacylase [Verrucomicrobiota bacterium JB023]|nr:D-aminoacyl-tRNA deacylase [Verrucomicrobiota bacterium JB023]
MRALIQRVSRASVTVDGQVIANQGNGLLILLGIEEADDGEDIAWLVRKISQMRIFEDEEGRMNRSLLDVDGEATVVSQFTLHASTKKGNRPSYLRAAKPALSKPLYEQFCQSFSITLGKEVQRGQFGAMMDVALVNQGPVTIWLDSKNPE